ncbi:hypothetical protein H0H93_008155 [Arthromyces matolae]|nr:hypothetical protein H0H93_008155 [Arthromyces matolae]
MSPADMSLDDLALQFDLFLDEAQRLKSKYASQITLLIGLETEHISKTDLEQLEKLLERVGSRIDYLVGSVHHVNTIPIDFDLPTFKKALNSLNVESGSDDHVQHEALLSSYFDSQYELLERFRPEIVGHFDLCRLYTPELLLGDFPAVLAKAERNIIYAIEYGALFEVNAAAFRKGWNTAYPGRDVVELIQKHGGRFALSDDSHGPQAVGLNYHRLHQYLDDVGVNEIWYLQKSETANAAGRRVEPRKLQGNWRQHVFWQK